MPGAGPLQPIDQRRLSPPTGVPENDARPNGAQIAAGGVTPASLIDCSGPMGAAKQPALSALDQISTCLHRVLVVLRSVHGWPQATATSVLDEDKSTTHEENHA